MILQVPGARIAYEVRGDGPLLVLIAGANGDATIFEPLAEQLAAHFRVSTYDRRGFSRSRLDGAQAYEHRLRTDADDVRRVIQALGDEPAIVFGSSSGAIVALRTLIDHPAWVKTLIAHEPPLVSLLPDAPTWHAFFDSLYQIYLESGIEAALQRFARTIIGDYDRRALMQAPEPANREVERANRTYWFEHELRQYPCSALDLETLGVFRDRLLLACGRESREQMTYRPNALIAERLGIELLELPGGHVGYATDRVAFAKELSAALQRV
ncbi:MAG TPA: alpha/beta hydrolase [Polyangiales bacterium]